MFHWKVTIFSLSYTLVITRKSLNPVHLTDREIKLYLLKEYQRICRNVFNSPQLLTNIWEEDIWGNILLFLTIPATNFSIHTRIQLAAVISVLGVFSHCFHSFYIYYLEFFCKEDMSFHHLIIYSIIYSYKYKLIRIYFILVGECDANVLIIYFITWIIPALDIGSSYKSAPVLFWHVLFLPRPLLSGTTKCSRLIISFPCPDPRISHIPSSEEIIFKLFSMCY